MLYELQTRYMSHSPEVHGVIPGHNIFSRVMLLEPCFSLDGKQLSMKTSCVRDTGMLIHGYTKFSYL